jgi:hypothetical protein
MSRPQKAPFLDRDVFYVADPISSILDIMEARVGGTPENVMLSLT